MKQPRSRTWRPLDELADDANDYLDKFRSSLRTTIFHANDAGEALNTAKRYLKYLKNRSKKAPNFCDWLKKNFKGSHETANIFMRINRHWEVCLKPIVLCRDLTIAQAVDILRAYEKALKQEIKGTQKEGTEAEKSQEERDEEQAEMRLDHLRQRATTIWKKWLHRVSPSELKFIVEDDERCLQHGLFQYKKQITKIALMFTKARQSDNFELALLETALRMRRIYGKNALTQAQKERIICECEAVEMPKDKPIGYKRTLMHHLYEAPDAPSIHESFPWALS